MCAIKKRLNKNDFIRGQISFKWIFIKGFFDPTLMLNCLFSFLIFFNRVKIEPHLMNQLNVVILVKHFLRLLFFNNVSGKGNFFVFDIWLWSNKKKIQILNKQQNCPLVCCDLENANVKEKPKAKSFSIKFSIVKKVACRVQTLK